MKRKWTSKDDDVLRRLHAEGRHGDMALAYITGWSVITIHRRRKKLGLPLCETRGGMRKGCKWNEESKARLSERMREHMRKPEVRAAWMELAWKGNRNRWAGHRYLPPKGTPERNLYRKLRDSGLPADVARQEIGRG